MADTQVNQSGGGGNMWPVLIIIIVLLVGAALYFGGVFNGGDKDTDINVKIETPAPANQ
jgi:hypothetical protein